MAFATTKPKCMQLTFQCKVHPKETVECETKRLTHPCEGDWNGRVKRKLVR